MSEFTQHTKPSLKRFLNTHVTGIDIIAAILIVLLVMGNVFFMVRYSQLEDEFTRNQDLVQALDTNVNVLAFAQAFIDDVLKAEREIDFETRLNLESTVRALEDEEIFEAWQQFTNSATEREAQNSVKDLLSILISRIRS